MQEELILKEKVLRTIQIRNVHELEDESPTKKMRSQCRNRDKNTRQFSRSLPNCSKCKDEWILWMILKNFKMWNQITVRVLVPCFGRIRRLPLDTWNPLETNFSTLGSPTQFAQRIPSDDVQKKPSNSLSEAERTKTGYTSEDRQNQGTIPMSSHKRNRMEVRF